MKLFLIQTIFFLAIITKNLNASNNTVAKIKTFPSLQGAGFGWDF